MDTSFNHTVTRKPTPISDAVMGMIFVLCTVAMFFSGLISAYIVNSSAPGVWPPLNQPRLPVEVTFFNTLLLVTSAVFMGRFVASFRAEKMRHRLLKISLILGTVFLLVQGTEWVKLVRFGFTSTSSLFGSFFYLIVGAHALHVLAGAGMLIYLNHSVRVGVSSEMLKPKVDAISLYWFFVCAIWPLLYWLVYIH